MMKSTIPPRFFVGLVLILVLFTAFSFSMAKIASTSAKDRFMKTQQMLARAQASNIQTFFEDFGTSVRILAQSPSVKYRNAATVEKMDTWLDEWADSGLVKGVALTDSKGIVRFNSNMLGTRDIGASLADREHFLWASKQESGGEYIVGAPVLSRVGGTKGKMIAPVVSPVFINGVFAGEIATSVELEALTERYVTLMGLSDGTIVHLINSSGDILSTTRSADEGRILKDAAEVIVKTGTEGSIETRGYVVSYAAIPLGNERWWVVVVSPAREMATIVQTIYVRQIAMLPIALVTLLVVWLLAQKRLW